jgi:SAM-dependent methyltransferase
MTLNTHAIAPAVFPSMKRLGYLFRETRLLSLTRVLEYEQLSASPALGKVLDIGGGENATYLSLIDYTEYKSINIDPSMNPTWVLNVGDAFPCEDLTFDAALSMNTFEHVYDVNYMLSEIFRVLRPGGQLIAAVPFLFPLHAHPDDFFRPTPSWFAKSLTQAGFSRFEIQPLCWGPFSVGLTASGAPGPFHRLQHQIGLLLDLLYVKTKLWRRRSVEVEEMLLKHALAFFVKATK